MNIRRFSQIAFMLLMLLVSGAEVSLAAVTTDDIKITVTNPSRGSLTASSIGDLTAGCYRVTLTASPVTANYGITATDIIVQPLVDPASTRSNNPGIANNLTVSGSGTTFYFDLPERYHGAQVTATFTEKSLTEIESLSEITTQDGCYKIRDGVTSVSGTPGVTEFKGVLDGNFVPFNVGSLFSKVNGAVIKNVIISKAKVSGGTNAGAIANEATGASRIYNCGVNSGSVSGSGNVGSIVGSLEGTSRVINCYSFADVSGGSNVGGIVGNNKGTTTATSITTMVMNCIFYGNITSGTNVSPVYGGNKIANTGTNALNTYTYYAYDNLHGTNSKAINKPNCTLAVKEQNLTRFEYYRQLLNGNRKLAALYALNDATKGEGENNEMAKWVLDKDIAPYPILKKQGKYPSIINYDPGRTYDAESGKMVSRSSYSEDNRNKGGTMGTLDVYINSVGTNAPTGASIVNSKLTPVRTDKDFDDYNFNFDKIQLPYYNDVGTGNYTENKVVTGWKITSVSIGSGDDVAEEGTFTPSDTWNGYNFADRKTYAKDIYSSTNIRVFSQGAYFDVPYGATAIYIEPYWGKAAYICDPNYDVVVAFNSGDNSGTNVDVLSAGTQGNSLLASGQTIYNVLGEGQNIFNKISTALETFSGSTVYDNALVLVGNLHLWNVPSSGSKPFTIMSADFDKDNEPDYSLIYTHYNRTAVSPIRFDFLNVPGMAMAQKPDNAGTDKIRNVPIFRPKGWFEVTNTCLISFSQLEYENPDNFTKTDAPVILLGGEYEQFVSTQNSTPSHTQYIHVGSNAYFKDFSNGTHSDGWRTTKHIPISATGGDYETFYLSGAYRPDAGVPEDDAEGYISGGRFGEVAGAGQQQIDGNVRWQIYDADIREFYGGGINDEKPITGNIIVDIFNSHVTTYCGGPKFGDMQKKGSITITYATNKAGSSTSSRTKNISEDRTVKTNAYGCTFNEYFGAGYGGISYVRKRTQDESSINKWSTWESDYTNNKGKYFDGTTTHIGDNSNDPKGSKGGPGIAVDFDYEFFIWSSGKSGGRFYNKYASLSLATTNDVISNLYGCNITHDFYGGGHLGKVDGTITSNLNGCTVGGDVFGAGYSADKPTVPYTDGGFATYPSIDADIFNYGEKTTTIKNLELKQVATNALENNQPAIEIYGAAKTVNGVTIHGSINTDVELDKLGVAAGKVTLNINDYTVGGTTKTSSITGSVYGGGASSDATDDVEVNIKGGTMTDVYGGGQGKTTVVGGDVTVNIGKLKEGTTNTYEGDATISGSVYGGSALGSVNAKKDDDWDEDTKPNAISAVAGKETKVNLLKGTVNGNVYGGGLGQQDVLNANNEVTTPGIAANVYGPVTVTVEGGTAQNVFGCNNLNGTPKSAVEVFINGTAASTGSGANKTYALQGVYGGGNLAHYDPTTPSVTYPKVTINGCSTSIEDVYGGGKAAAVPNTNVIVNGGDIKRVFAGGNGESGTPANVGWKSAKVSPVDGDKYTGTYDGAGAAKLDINGGTIVQVFGGSNANGKVRSGSTIDINKEDNACEMHITNVFGGGNEAAGAAGTIRIGCTGGDTEGITNVYGGANKADVTGDIELNITGGRITNVFGGNNEDGSISGNITVNVEWDGSCTDNYLGNVYGGGNLAPYGGANDNKGNYPVVNIKNGTVSGNVYGGGYGTTAIVYGNPQVTIGDATAGYEADVTGDVYGGGDAAAVIGTPFVHVINKDNTSIGNVYGGGNAADVSATSVTIDGGTIGMVFGGGHGDKNSDPQKAANVTGGVSVTVTGGTITKVFGGSNSKGNIDGTIALGITKAADASTMKIGEVYGGGNEAAGNAGTINIGCTGTLVALGEGERYGYEQEGIGYVYGGANNADVGNNITLNITGGIVANVFGGNNTGGNISGSITVNIEKDASAACVDNWYVGNVYGGGNVASYRPTTVGAYPEVNIKNGTVSGSVFGGGLGATAKVCSNPKVTIGDLTEGHSSYEAIVTGDVYGGGSAAMVGDDTEGKTSTNNTTVLIQKANSSVANVFGGGMAASVTGTTSVTIAGGTVSTGVYGGCNTSGSVGAVTIALNGGTVGTDETNRADVYGGGFGNLTTTTSNIGITLGTDATTGTTVYGDIYGGSALGYVNASASNTSTVTLTSATLYGSVFGGGKGQNTPSEITATSNGGATVNVNVANTHLTGIYGGANVRGNVKGAIAVNINANVGASGTGNSLDIFGGGYGANTKTEGNVTVNIGDADGTYQPVIYGDIYGGSALGNVNNEASDITTVNFLNGTLHGNLYGGGLGDGSNAAKVNGQVIVNIGTSTQTDAQCHIDLSGASIYGCNNTNGSPQDNVTVNIYKTAHTEKNAASYTGADATYAIDQVFGGGNQADYAPENGSTSSTKKTSVHVYGCDNTIRRVFGGGNAAAAVGVVTEIYSGRFDYVYGGGNGEVTAANIGAGGTNLQIHGGKINNLFGGSNEQGTISGNMGVAVDNNCDCEQSGTSTYVDEFFCGNNLASIGTPENPVNITATIACGTRFGAVYGGCSLAPLYGSVNLTVEGGEMNYVYGGSKGDLARLNDELGETGHTDTPANISGNVTLTIKGGKIKNVFGGSNINGNIAGSIEVNIEKNDASTCKDGWYIGNVYGASNLAAYKPTVEGNTLKVNIKNGTVSGNVYGGGKGASATVTSNPVVTIGDVTNENYKAIIADDANDKDVNNAAFVGGNVYGGGDAAPVVGNTTVTYNDNNANTSVANIYGGGNNASVSGNATVTLKGKATVEHDVFGGGNEGIVVGTAKVNIEE